MDFKQQFIQFAIEQQALCFGEFTLKSGRHSPYFFNTGYFNNGHALRQLAYFYVEALLASDLRIDMLYGPAYKGIPLVSAIAMTLAERGINYPFSFNRKEQKDHGEGGSIVGAPLHGRVLIVDDVISAGISVSESVAIIQNAGATPAGVLITLDRMEKTTEADKNRSAVQEISEKWDIPIISVINLDNLLGYLKQAPSFAEHYQPMLQYKTQYGV